MMSWNTSEAQSHFSILLDACLNQPQVVRKGEKPVAVLLDVELFREFMKYKPDMPGSEALQAELSGREIKRRTMAELMEELRIIREEEPFELDIPPRMDRPNPFLEE